MKFESPLGNREVRPATPEEVAKLHRKIATDSLTDADKQRIWELEEDEIRRKWNTITRRRKK